MPLFTNLKNRVEYSCKRKLVFRFFIFLKKRHNNIEKIDVIEIGGGILYHLKTNTGLGEKLTSNEMVFSFFGCH